MAASLCKKRLCQGCRLHKHTSRACLTVRPSLHQQVAARPPAHVVEAPEKALMPFAERHLPVLRLTEIADLLRPQPLKPQLACLWRSRCLDAGNSLPEKRRRSASGKPSDSSAG